MTNEERIERLRKCASFETCNPEVCDLWSKDDCRSILLKDAADALEAAEKRIADLEAQIPKEGEWIDLFGHDYKCSVCGEWYRMDGTPEQEDMNYCPNCGARMRTVTDCHTLNER